MSIRTSLASSLAALSTLGLAACADLERNESVAYTTYTEYVPGPEPAAKEITRFADENRDGKVTREEAKADPNLARAFDQYDADKSGDLNRAEFAQLEAAAQPEGGSYRTVTRRVAADRSNRGDERSLNRTGIDEIRPDPAD